MPNPAENSGSNFLQALLGFFFLSVVSFFVFGGMEQGGQVSGISTTTSTSPSTDSVSVASENTSGSSLVAASSSVQDVRKQIQKLLPSPENKRTEKKEETVVPAPAQIGFFVNFPSDISSIGGSLPVSGTKPAGASVELNGSFIVSGGEGSVWAASVPLVDGENRLVFIARDGSGREVGRSAFKIDYKRSLSVTREIPRLSSFSEFVSNLSSDTFLPKPEASSLVDPTLSPLFTSNAQADIQSEFVGGPKLFSTTHTDSSVWSSNANPTFVWEDVSGALSYQVSLSSVPEEPREDVGKRTSISYQNLVEGVWYFGVRAVKVDGSGSPATFHRLLIDRTPPKVTSVSFENPEPTYQNGSLVTVRVRFSDNLFNTPFTESQKPLVLPTAFLDESDRSLVGSYYDQVFPFARFVNVDFSSLDSDFSKSLLMSTVPYKVGSGEFETVVSYRIGSDNRRLDKTDIPLTVTVSDFAGNSSVSQLRAELANRAPIKLDQEAGGGLYRQEEVGQRGVVLSGTSFPDATVTLFIYSEPFVATLRADGKGRWNYVVREQLPSGNHTVYAQSEDAFANKTPVVQIGSFSIISQAAAKEAEELITKLTVASAPSEELSVGRSRETTDSSRNGALVLGSNFSLILFGVGGSLLGLGCLVLIWYLRRDKKFRNTV